MRSLKDIIRCPQCGGSDIVYSCEPKCCFNHVCADCRSTFEINTHKTGRFDAAYAAEIPEPESGEPTTGCANCESLKIAVIEEDAGEACLLVCGNCHAILQMRVEEFVPGFTG